MDKNRNTKFLSDIVIYGIGNLGSKLITFLLVPLYTYFVNPSDFGYYDLTMNMIFLIIPFLTFQLKDGAFRLLLDNNSEYLRTGIISFTYKFITLSSTVVSVLAFIISFFYKIQYIEWCIISIIIMSFYEIVTQVVRGLERNKYFVISGILTAFFIGLFSIIFVVIFKMGIRGIFLANIISRALVLGFLEYRLRIYKKYFFYKFNDKYINRILVNYSLPLLPNVICWWVICGSNRLFVQHYLGIEANGIYAIGLKLSTILETFTVIIYQAWQDTAIKQYHSKDKNAFFSEIFNIYLIALTALSVGFTFILKICYTWIIDERYYTSLQYIYILCVSVIFYGLASFLDLGYLCSKQTKKVIPGIIMASIINIVFNYLLIQYFNIYGVAFSSVLTFIFLFIFRIIDTRKYFKIEFTSTVIYSSLIVIISGIVFYFTKSVLFESLYLIVIIGVTWIISPRKIKEFSVLWCKKVICKAHFILKI